jgi:predicted DNA-binding transcriptional regulator YafY
MTARRNRQLLRTLRLVLLLEQRRSTIDELATELGAHQRTVRRDLEVLEEAGIPLVNDGANRDRRWRVFNWRTELKDGIAS